MITIRVKCHPNQLQLIVKDNTSTRRLQCTNCNQKFPEMVTLRALRTEHWNSVPVFNWDWIPTFNTTEPIVNFPMEPGNYRMTVTKWA